MWPNARISVMGGEQAGASVLATVKRATASKPRAAAGVPEEEERFKAPIRQQYEDQGHPYYATARLWDDGVIGIRRHALRAGAGPIAARNAPIEDTRFAYSVM